MESILGWGLDVIRSVQTVEAPWLTAVMTVVTSLGAEYFYLVALAFAYWCVDERKGARIGLVILFSSFLNGWIKNLVAEPRPFAIDPTVKLAEESTFAFPSGHAQGTASFWTMASTLFRAPWGIALAIVLPLVVGFSRVYLGMHYPTDVFAGWILGYAIAIAALAFGPRVEALLAGTNIRLSLLIVAVVSLGMNLLDPGLADNSGAFFGVGIGVVLSKKLAPFSAKGRPGPKALRMLIGLAGVAILYFGLKAVEGFANANPIEFMGNLANILRFGRYAAIGAWATLGAPWLFLKLRIADRAAVRTELGGTAPAGGTGD